MFLGFLSEFVFVLFLSIYLNITFKGTNKLRSSSCTEWNVWAAKPATKIRVSLKMHNCFIRCPCSVYLHDKEDLCTSSPEKCSLRETKLCILGDCFIFNAHNRSHRKLMRNYEDIKSYFTCTVTPLAVSHFLTLENNKRSETLYRLRQNLHKADMITSTFKSCITGIYDRSTTHDTFGAS